MNSLFAWNHWDTKHLVQKTLWRRRTDMKGMKSRITQSKSDPMSPVTTQYWEQEEREVPVRKFLHIWFLVEIQRRDVLHEGKTYKFSDPEIQVLSHQERWLAGSHLPPHPTPGEMDILWLREQLLRKRHREQICHHACLVTQSTCFPVKPSTGKVRMFTLYHWTRTGHLTFYILKLKRKSKLKGRLPFQGLAFKLTLLY